MLDRSGRRGPNLLLSVIVPTRNRAAYLSDSLASLASQVCAAELEFIVVDNASTDRTPEVLEEWRRRDARVHSFCEERLGRSQAMNAGAALARGSLLLFTDDDVVAEPRWAETLRALLARHANDSLVAGGPIVPIPKDLAGWPPWLAPEALVDVGALDWGPDERPLERYEHLWGANMAIRADVFDCLGPWDEAIGRRGEERGTYEDVEYQERIRAAGGTVWFCPGARIYHRVSRNDVTPRRLLSSAFSRGRNEFWRTQVLGAPSISAVEERRGPVSSFGSWAARTLGLRRGIRRDRIEAARRAAFSTGWAMERALVGRDGGKADRLIRTASWSGSRAILRATPSTSRRGEVSPL